MNYLLHGPCTIVDALLLVLYGRKWSTFISSAVVLETLFKLKVGYRMLQPRLQCTVVAVVSQRLVYEEIIFGD